MLKPISGALAFIPAAAVSLFALFGWQPTDPDTIRSLNAQRDARTESIVVENEHKAAMYGYEERKQAQEIEAADLKLQAIADRNAVQHQSDQAWAALQVELGRVAAYCLLGVATVLPLLVGAGWCYRTFVAAGQPPHRSRRVHHIVARPWRDD